MLHRDYRMSSKRACPVLVERASAAAAPPGTGSCAWRAPTLPPVWHGPRGAQGSADGASPAPRPSAAAQGSPGAVLEPRLLGPYRTVGLSSGSPAVERQVGDPQSMEPHCWEGPVQPDPGGRVRRKLVGPGRPVPLPPVPGGAPGGGGGSWCRRGIPVPYWGLEGAPPAPLESLHHRLDHAARQGGGLQALGGPYDGIRRTAPQRSARCGVRLRSFALCGAPRAI